MDTLDNFFSDLKLIVEPEMLSDCCGVIPLGETFLLSGRCSECFEGTMFTKVDEEAS